MKTITHFCIATAASVVTAIGCTEKLSPIHQTSTAPASKTVVYERNSAFPLTDYLEVRENILSKFSTPVDLSLEDFIGCSYKTTYYPLEDANNIGLRVIDVGKYTEDYPGRLVKVPINQSHATSYSYSDFERMSEKTEIEAKMTIGSSSNIFKIFSHSAETTFSDVFGSYASSTDKTVYGESTISYLADRYSFSLPPALYERVVDGYLTDDFIEYLYSSSPEQLFNSLGCFVLTQFISGANATAIYTATEKAATSATLRESHMDNLISASVGLGDLFSVGVTFGNSNSQSSGDTITHNFASNRFSIHTYGGTAIYIQFTPPKDVNDAYFDLSSWCKSLEDESTHTIADIPNNSLIPLYEFIEEDNLKEHLNDIMKQGYADNNSLQEPYIHIKAWNIYSTPEHKTVLEIYSHLSTRYGDLLELSFCELTPRSNLDVDHFLTYECNRLKKQYPNLKIVIDEIPDITPSIDFPFNHGIGVPVTLFQIDTTQAEINLNTMKKYIEPSTGKIYLLPDTESDADIVCTIYGDYTINDYTFRDKLESMETVNGIDLDALRQSYRLIAL